MVAVAVAVAAVLIRTRVSVGHTFVHKINAVAVACGWGSRGVTYRLRLDLQSS
jgi:hypothetical protein